MEFVLDAYGWRPGDVDELTDEQLVAFVDAAIDRLEDHANARFETLVEAVRSGTIIAHDRNAYQRWRANTRADAAKRIGNDGVSIKLELEAMIGALAASHPQYVAFGPREGSSA